MCLQNGGPIGATDVTANTKAPQTRIMGFRQNPSLAFPIFSGALGPNGMVYVMWPHF